MIEFTAERLIYNQEDFNAIIDAHEYHYCIYCGQRIDWSDEA